MSVLAHVFESAGIATVVLASMRGVVEQLGPPRSLFCEFPLGRPLGKPNDAEYQHGVLSQAFALLDAESGPVIDDHPDVIEEATEAVSCQLPPAFDPNLHPAIDEANGIRKAYERTVEQRGTTSVGRVLGPDQIIDGLEVLIRLADGEHWREVPIPSKSTTGVVHDIRTYYEEAALSLVDTKDIGGRALEEWFFTETEAGKLVMDARRAVKDQEAPMPVWFYMAPGQRQ